MTEIHHRCMEECNARWKEKTTNRGAEQGTRWNYPLMSCVLNSYSPLDYRPKFGRGLLSLNVTRVTSSERRRRAEIQATSTRTFETIFIPRSPWVYPSAPSRWVPSPFQLPRLPDFQCCWNCHGTAARVGEVPAEAHCVVSWRWVSLQLLSPTLLWRTPRGPGSNIFKWKGHVALT